MNTVYPLYTRGFVALSVSFIYHTGFPLRNGRFAVLIKKPVDERKIYIQTELRKEMALLVDIPMAGCGNTNSDNTVRRFFQQPDLASQITGGSETIIRKFGVVLRDMSCGYNVNTDAFRQYAYETAEIFVHEYPWFYMPSSIHKILIHGGEIISNVGLPIGMMSEEALEARNKDVRNFRLLHIRKTSRQHTMADLMHALLFSSDPFISSLSKGTRTSSRNNIELDTEVKTLLSIDNLQSPDSWSDSSDSE